MAIEPSSDNRPRVVILGAGFGGLRLARKLAKSPFDVILVDRNNFHQFQPLFYQVATAGLAPSSISFPIRKAFHNKPSVKFRLAEVERIDPDGKEVHTSIGRIAYDYLVVALGADTNYFNNNQIAKYALPMKSVQESLALRNWIIESMERAVLTTDGDQRKALMNVVVVGGGPTGTEVAGALAEMRDSVLPKDYPDLDFTTMEIHLIEAGPKLLGSMSTPSSEKSLAFLNKMGVEVSLNTLVASYDGHTVTMKGGRTIVTKTLIWAAGIKGNPLHGIPDSAVLSNGRIKVNSINEVEGMSHVFAIGDIAYMEEERGFTEGHPQVAQVAIQQADRLVKNLRALHNGESTADFRYKDLGSMATIGRNKAVVDLPFLSFQGFIAWLTWLFVHLMAIVGVRNRLFIFMAWMWNYFTYDQSLRLIIRQKPRSEENRGEASEMSSSEKV